MVGCTLKAVGAGLFTLALAIGLADTAHACSPPVPLIGMPPVPAPGTPPVDAQALGKTWNIVDRSKREVADRDAKIARQASMFDAAASVVLARIDSTGRSSGAPPEFSHINGLTYVMMKPLRWVKGQGMSETFQLGWNGMTSCGPTPEYDAIRGEPGDVFLIYLSGATLKQENVTGTLAVDKLIEARTLAALDAALSAQQ